MPVVSFLGSLSSFFKNFDALRSALQSVHSNVAIGQIATRPKGKTAEQHLGQAMSRMQVL